MADPADGAAQLENMLREGADGVATGQHVYYRRDDDGALEDPTPHVAAFLLVQQEHYYYFGSTGWFDKDWAWDALYDLQCGQPKAAASSVAPAVYTREFDACTVRLNCSVCAVNMTRPCACEGSIKPSP